MIRLVEHRPGWAEEFRAEAVRLRAHLGDRVVDLEHIGSTAVPGLVAKPILDLGARAAPGADPFGLAEAVAPLEYRQLRSGPANHGVYVRMSPDGARTHILHVFAFDGWDSCPQRLFRDRLRHDADARRRYGELKTRLAATLTDGREYTAAKRDLVETLLNEERAARGLPPTTAWDK
ncbi:GrpB family protein [Isoptericola sp. NPDC057559]|uniref:GrpB family protein n=1 Tax=Isoptericola sp. NPDC057559 TaxID=3346168 RepID=UPI00369EC48C